MIRKAFVLAAGFGTRMGELTKEMPKPLLPVGGRPLIDHTLFYLREWGIREIVVNVHYHAAKLARHLSSFPYATIRISHEAAILGTAGGVRKGMDLFSDTDSPFLLTNPDTILLPEYDARTNRIFNPATLQPNQTEFDACLYLIRRPGDSRETGFSFIDPENSARAPSPGSGPDAENISSPFRCEKWRKVRMSADQGSHYYMGVSVLNPRAIADLSPGIPAELGRRWTDSSESGRLYGCVWNGSVLDAGRRESYEELRDRLPTPPYLMDSWKEFCEGWPIPT